MIRRIAVLPGDGVGAEVIAGPFDLLKLIAAIGHIELTGPWPVGASAFGELGTGLPESTLAACDEVDALFFGAAGEHPGVSLAHYRPEHAIIGLRQRYDLRVSIRSVSRGDGSQPIIVVRNLLGGAYGDTATRTESDGISAACDKVILTRPQIVELAEIACDMVARGLASNIISVDKANLMATGRLWRQTTADVAASRGVPIRHCYVDRMAFELAHDDVVSDTVILTEGIFGDILSDLAAGRAGSIALCGSASVNPRPVSSTSAGPGGVSAATTPTTPHTNNPTTASDNPGGVSAATTPTTPHTNNPTTASGGPGDIPAATTPTTAHMNNSTTTSGDAYRCVGLFEPVHGSAPRHTGTGRVNPTGAYMALIALLEWFEETAHLAPPVSAALNHTLNSGPLTYDLAPPGADPVGTASFAAAVNARALPLLKELL